MPLPADSHVHSQWSWDTEQGSMRRTCETATRLGVPVVAFTEHLDHTTWTLTEEELADEPSLRRLAEDGTRFTPPRFDVAGYLACVEECRDRFPDLRILTGLEVGEPHRHEPAVTEVLSAGSFDRVLGSLHCLDDEARDGYIEPAWLFADRDPLDVARRYLAEIPDVVASSVPFAIVAHIDYVARGVAHVGRAVRPARARGRAAPRAGGRRGLRASARAQHPGADPPDDRALVARGGRRGGVVRQRRPRPDRPRPRLPRRRAAGRGDRVPPGSQPGGPVGAGRLRWCARMSQRRTRSTRSR